MTPTHFIARCPEHGLHGQRDACFVCGGPVEQVEMTLTASKTMGFPGEATRRIERLESDVAVLVEMLAVEHGTGLSCREPECPTCALVRKAWGKS